MEHSLTSLCSRPLSPRVSYLRKIAAAFGRQVIIFGHSSHGPPDAVPGPHRMHRGAGMARRLTAVLCRTPFCGVSPKPFEFECCLEHETVVRSLSWKPTGTRAGTDWALRA